MDVSPKDSTPHPSPPTTTHVSTDNVRKEESSKPAYDLQVACVSTYYDGEASSISIQDEEGFLELGFLGDSVQDTIPLAVVFPSSY